MGHDLPWLRAQDHTTPELPELNSQARGYLNDQAFYILPSRERAEAEMKKLDKTLRSKYGIKV